MEQFFFLFYKDQLVITDKREKVLSPNAGLPADVEVFDASGRRLQIEKSAIQDAAPEEPAFRKKIAAFWELAESPLPGIETLPLKEIVRTSVKRLQAMEWKSYQRRSRLFWSVMGPCGLLPFWIGLFKIPKNPQLLLIYVSCFAAAGLGTFILYRILYPKPPFPKPE